MCLKKIRKTTNKATIGYKILVTESSDDTLHSPYACQEYKIEKWNKAKPTDSDRIKFHVKHGGLITVFLRRVDAIRYADTFHLASWKSIQTWKVEVKGIVYIGTDELSQIRTYLCKQIKPIERINIKP